MCRGERGRVDDGCRKLIHVSLPCAHPRRFFSDGLSTFIQTDLHGAVSIHLIEVTLDARNRRRYRTPRCSMGLPSSISWVS